LSSDVLEEDGTITPYTDAIKLRQQQTVSIGTSIGWSGSSFSAAVMPELFFVGGTALPATRGFTSLCEWIARLLGRTVLRAQRVAVCAKNLHKDITAALRDGESVVASMLTRLTSHQLLREGGEQHGDRTQQGLPAPDSSRESRHGESGRGGRKGSRDKTSKVTSGAAFSLTSE